jgi:small subunit ribosomal protein S11e
MTEVQTERAFLKQEAVSLNGQAVRLRGARKRWYKSIGLGIKTPREAIEGTYIDKKCPFTSNVSIRGRILRGVVVSTKMTRTVIVRRDYLHWVAKYRRYERRHRNIPCHASPCFRLHEGDIVTIGQCRPLSKTVRFNIIRVDRSAGGKDRTGKKMFTGL